MGYVYESLQWLIWAVLLVPLHLLSWVLRAIRPDTLGMAIGRGPYYWAVVRKRRARGEDEWQEHDIALGIGDPSVPDPRLPGMDGLGPVPECSSCGNPLYGPEGFDTCLMCWRRDVTERLDA